MTCESRFAPCGSDNDLKVVKFRDSFDRTFLTTKLCRNKSVTYILYAKSLRPMYPSKKIDKYNYYVLIPTKTVEG